MKPEFSECRAVHTCVSSHCHDREIGAALEALICSWPFNQRMVQITPHLSSGLFPSTLPQLLLFLLFIYAVSFWTKISVKLLWGHFYLSPSQEAAYISEPLELNQVSESQWTANKSEAKACLRPRTAPPPLFNSWMDFMKICEYHTQMSHSEFSWFHLIPVKVRSGRTVLK